KFVQRTDDDKIISEIPSRYEVSKRLGAGGHGIVFKAYDSSLAKDVAIKLLLTPDDPKLLERCDREAKPARNLNLPSIVTVCDFGVTSGDKPYRVLEYIDGLTIEQLLTRSGPYSPVQALPIFLQIAEGISYAHEHNVRHRDLKTGNILVRSEGEKTTVKIVD